MMVFGLVSLLGACGSKTVDKNINFTLLVQEVNGNQLMGFVFGSGVDDMASVYYPDDYLLDFVLKAGNKLLIEASPLIKESYPVQISAVEVKLAPVASMMIKEKQLLVIMANFDVVVLDVRSREEYLDGHIPEAILLPNTEIKDKIEQLALTSDQIIVVYCKSGNRSRQAAETLVALGYTNIYDFGGFGNWTGEITVVEVD